MSGLVDFLRARLDEDEAAARLTWGGIEPYVIEWYDEGEDEPGYFAADNDHDVKHLSKFFSQMRHRIPIHAPARVLAEVEAKRRIVDLHGDFNHECSTYDHNGEIDNCTWVMDSDDCSTVRLLALPYADHPDYRDEWKP